MKQCVMNKMHKQNFITILQQIPPSFVSGKMSAVLYFYQLSRLENNNEYKKIADKYIDEVFSGIGLIKDIDIKNGVSGIGLAIHYLIKNNFVSGNINTILQEIDDTLFKTVSVDKHCELLTTLSLIQVLYYFYVRLQDQQKDSENEYLFRELCIKIINNIYQKLDKTELNNRLVYNVEYELPLFLYVLSKIYTLDFYNVRIVNILKELSPLILSNFPILHSNKLYILWAMTTVNKHVEIVGWQTHIELLQRELNLEIIVTEELKNRNIFFNDGVTSLFLLAEKLRKQLKEKNVCAFQQKLLVKIEQSEAWHLLETDPNMYLGLYDGFCGVALLLMKYRK